MKIAVLGTGSVGQAFATRLTGLGHEVMVGTRNPAETLNKKGTDAWGNTGFGDYIAQNPAIKVGAFAEAAAFGELIINATKGANALEILHMAGEANLNGKILVDITNPLDFSKGMPPSLIPELSNTNSLGEEIQRQFPNVKVVKTLNTMWNGLMINPNLIGGGDHVNYIAGNDAEAKNRVKAFLNELGWKNESLLDLGDITASRATEGTLPIWLRVWGATNNGAFNFRIIS